MLWRVLIKNAYVSYGGDSNEYLDWLPPYVHTLVNINVVTLKK